MTMQDNTQTAASVTANAAETARESLAAALNKAKTAGTAVLVKLYGAGADSASVKLAVSAAKVLAGGDKPRGGAAQRINDTIKAVIVATGDESDNLTPAIFAAAARAVLDAAKDAQKARRDKATADRKAARDVLNDRGRTKADRMHAADLLVELDEEIAREKAGSVMARLESAVKAARDGGLTYESVLSVVLDAYPNADKRAELIAA